MPGIRFFGNARDCLYLAILFAVVLTVLNGETHTSLRSWSNARHSNENSKSNLRIRRMT